MTAALLRPAVEDITGAPCRRLDCDGIHAWDGLDAWAPNPEATPVISPVAAADLHLPVVRGATTTDPEENPMSQRVRLAALLPLLLTALTACGTTANPVAGPTTWADVAMMAVPWAGVALIVLAMAWGGRS